jgi:hypothetical protein
MRRSVIAGVLWAVLTVLTAIPASADDGIPPDRPGVVPATLTMKEKADNDKKLAAARQRTKQRPNAVQAQCDCGSAYGNIYKEPQAGYAINWCGAGTTTVISAGWQIKRNGYDNIPSYSRWSNPAPGVSGWYYGGDAFMQHMAYDRDAVRDGRYANYPPITEPSGAPGYDVSLETSVKDAANAEIQTAFYVVYQNVANLTNFDTVLRSTIMWDQVPISAVARACPAGGTCLPGWNGASSTMNHWVSLVSFDIPGNVLMYGDTASTSQAYFGNNPYGWHYFTRTTFFNTYMLPYMSGAVVW